ncbi:MAG: hypothetical protein AABX40_05030 [Candidatus Hydrothermarchaeota archaeon]
MSLLEVYRHLLNRFGTQGWWPVSSLAGGAGFDERGYHRGDYTYPRDEAQRFEVVLGAILTQNTAWRNVEMALGNLKGAGLLSPDAIYGAPEEKLLVCLRPAGYFRVKARRLRAFLDHRSQFYNGSLESLFSLPQEELREALLGINGIGPETADSIVLYAAHRPSFVIDAYTRRTFGRLGLLDPGAGYEDLRSLFEAELPEEEGLYNEFHALIVRHGKEVCRKIPHCTICPLRDICTYYRKRAKQL